MKYHLIQVNECNGYNDDGSVNGVILQDYTGCFEGAKKFAKETEIANGNKIKVIVSEYTYIRDMYAKVYNIIPINK